MQNSARCSHVPLCGGCSRQQIPYLQQLEEKQAFITSLFAPYIQAGTRLHPIFPSPSPWEYRNKMEFSFSQNKAGDHFLGLMLAKGRGRVLDLQECHLVQSWFLDVLKAVRQWWKQSGLAAYHFYKDTGTLRTLTLREGKRTGDKMVMLTVSGNPAFALSESQLKSFVAALPPAENQSIFIRVHQIAKGSPTQFYELQVQGPDHITESLTIQGRPLLFKISPTSFFQPNTAQAELLYSRALDMLSPSSEALVYDLYCGTGTLGMAIALKAKQVIGIELNPHAVFDAESNRELNQIANFTILCGDVGTLLAKENQADAVVIDPPRSGLDPLALQHVIRLDAKKILYISCNPTTQAQNIKVLTEAGYRLLELQPVDQFPHTPHIENIALLEKN